MSPLTFYPDGKKLGPFDIQARYAHSFTFSSKMSMNSKWHEFQWWKSELPWEWVQYSAAIKAWNLLESCTAPILTVSWGHKGIEGIPSSRRQPSQGPVQRLFQKQEVASSVSVARRFVRLNKKLPVDTSNMENPARPLWKQRAGDVVGAPSSLEAKIQGRVFPLAMVPRK